MNRILNIFVFTIIFSFSMGNNASYAQKENIDYTKLESLGLLQTGNEENLGADIYRHANRSELVYLLKNINRNPWIYLQKTIKNLLITSADSTAINNDIEITKGNDLLTLRITALMRMGYNKEAFELYNKASSYNLSEPLIRAGIFSMLLNKQKARACLEVKTSFDSYKDIDFWKEMNAYCMFSLSKVPAPQYAQTIKDSNNNILKEIINDKKYRFVYNPKSFSEINLLERSILIADDKILIPDGDFRFYKNVPAQHISQLLSQSNVSETTKATIATISVIYGYNPPQYLSDLYESFLEKYKDKKPKDNYWYRLAQIYKDTKSSWIPKKRKDKISEAFNIAEKYDVAVLIPLIPAIIKMKIADDISLENSRKILPLLLLNNIYDLEDWLKNLIELNHDDYNLNNIRLNLLTAISFMTNIKNEKVKNKVSSNVNSHLSSSPYKITLKNIIENIDSNTNNSDKLRDIDINGFDLVWNKRYTMPPYVVLRSLNQSSRNQDISVSLLLSAHILDKINNKELYVGTMSDIIIALNNLGLKQLPHLILAQAILQMEK